MKVRDVEVALARAGYKIVGGTRVLTYQQASAARAIIERDRQISRQASLAPEGRVAPASRPRPGREEVLRCFCCKLRFSIEVPWGQGPPSTCPKCLTHAPFEGEDWEHVATRLSDHLERTTAVMEAAARHATEAVQGRAQALDARDKWRALLLEVAVGHEEGVSGCSCGASKYPCSTLRTIRADNFGIWREVETYMAMKPDELHRALYGTDLPAVEDGES